MAIEVKQKHWWTLKVLQKWETANPNGRPRKWVSLFLKQCKDNDVVQVNKKDIEATYLSLINMSWEELEKVWKDKRQPFVVRKLAQFIVEAKDIDIIEKILDRWIWKTTQTTEATVKHDFVKVKLPWEEEKQEQIEENKDLLLN